MKLSKALLVLALSFFVAAPAFAETQNVKVSGSLDMYGFLRQNFDLSKDGGDNIDAGDSEAHDFFMGITQVEVSADLTDNVSTVINLTNEREWNDPATATNDIDLDLAYVQMKEIFYTPLTLTIGRQDIWFGRGFVVGNNSTAWDPNGSIPANEYSTHTAFDALRATLDFNPWTLDFVYAKIDENDINEEDDIDLYVVNVNYKFAEYNAVAEGYLVTEWDRTIDSASGDASSDTETIGGRIQFDPISQITLGAEIAYQFGDYQVSSSNVERDRAAWGFDIFGTYRWIDYAWKPSLTLEYVHFSGDDRLDTTGDYTAWNSLYRGKFWTAYADFREFLYTTDATGDQSATTNQQFIQVKADIKPLEDLLLEASFTYLWMDEEVNAAGEDELGWEIDLQATYDYTEDVSFGLLAGWFVPGDFYTADNDETAVDLVGSTKVTF